MKRKFYNQPKLMICEFDKEDIVTLSTFDSKGDNTFIDQFDEYAYVS